MKKRPPLLHPRDFTIPFGFVMFAVFLAAALLFLFCGCQSPAEHHPKPVRYSLAHE